MADESPSGRIEHLNYESEIIILAAIKLIGLLKESPFIELIINFLIKIYVNGASTFRTIES